jgi:hypothetical protein
MGIAEEGIALWWGNVELMAPLVVSTPGYLSAS